ncbi:hypothetical protein KEM60_00507 [Austwickia sp. TVS 96-490-7B]|uniref:ABC transporter permease n=1 Tax=Austwickia sp. TVS 96-490-7B TaxID=2830843 RepID=UPI001C59DEEA|nr:ABC transporter permease subunit [Austwickia sp. TVS 96-490-7B]MBW3084320.1 hypothetical protein [Austwickia sp. TVS 96-490-7B]
MSMTFIVGRDNRRNIPFLADAITLAGLGAALWLLVYLTGNIDVPFNPTHAPTEIDTNPAMLPYYAARSLFRMFMALAASLVFTLIYATAAARSRRLEKVLLPILDVLQSVPILGFLSITVSLWLALFPHSSLGVECASIFAIFTSQAWNMTFAFHAALRSQPRDLDESARVLRLTAWQRFWRLDVPSGMIPLVWNAMMSCGGGWFFLTASEVISVNNHTYALPGIGAYVAAASAHEDLGRLWLAIAVMIVMILLVNFLLWRPLTAWAEKFRIGDTSNSHANTSIVLRVLTRSHLIPASTRLLRPLIEFLDTLTRPLGPADPPLHPDERRRRLGDILFGTTVTALCLWGLINLLTYLNNGPGLDEFVHAFALGLVTLTRVIIVILVGTLIWVPLGVLIGMNPTITRLAQPLVQILASFPANFLFPFFTLFLLHTGITLDVGGIVLMALGSQWYILFNVIAGASAIPHDLREAATNLRLTRTLRWRTLIIPGIFSAWVTGAITAAGGAWNASIVSEIVTYGDTTLTSTGLGAYIAHATSTGDTPTVIIGVTVMSIYVVGLNRLFWHPLYTLAERRYTLS